jgi:uncharacterized protein (DUF433 family)
MNRFQFLLTDPEIQDGSPVFAGTHIRYETFCDYMRIGVTVHEFLHEFPSISQEQALQALDICKQNMSIDRVVSMSLRTYDSRQRMR